MAQVLGTLSVQPYKYRPLPTSAQTRILVLEPSLDASARLLCRLEEFNVQSGEGYEALSYTWGKPCFTERLVINNTSFLSITPNLRDALRRFRLPFSPRRLWVDAICINQSDEEEKGKQIPFMSVIYRGASAVLVWLGNYPAQAACLASIKAYPRLLDRWLSPGSRVGPQDHSELLLTSISSLAELPWFSRRWIVQEAVLNPDVLLCCCDEELSWVRLANSLEMVDNSPPRVRSLRTLLAMVNLWKRWVFNSDAPRNGGIFDLLEAFDSFQCFDDRDRLFALAGLATDLSLGANALPQQLPLRVDYTITTESLYATFCRDVLAFTSDPMKHQMLRSSLARCNDGQSDLPSWVPDWRLSAIRKPFFHYEVYNSLLRFNFGSSLILQGQYVRGAGSEVTEIYKPLPIHPSSASEISEWLRTAGNLWLDRYPHAGLGAYADFIAECAQSAGLQIPADSVFPIVSWVMSTGPFEIPSETEYIPFLMDIGNALKGRRVFVWSNPTEPSFSHLGVGPDHTQIGDKIMAIKRPSSPGYSFQVVLILRDVTGDAAKLVGDALLVLSLENSSFWFPSPEWEIQLDHTAVTRNLTWRVHVHRTAKRGYYSGNSME